MKLRRRFEDWYGEGQTLNNLALTHRAAERLAEARAAWLQAAEAYARADAPAEARNRAAALDTPTP